MAQITIYLDEKTENKMKEVTSSQNISQSKWIACLIKEKLRNDWPVSLKELAGSWKNFPTAEELRKILGTDVNRKKL